MEVFETGFEGLFELKPTVFEDSRGYFYESYNQQVFDEKCSATRFVQDNQSKSGKGVLRGLHFQIYPYAQAKLVRVLSGEVLDVVVDLRKDQKTYGKSYKTKLSQENKRQLFIPRGFAHGFLVLSESAEFFYKCDNFYSKSHERGIIYNDKALEIDWLMSEEELLISPKDLELPAFKDLSPENLKF
ncbi:MAG: dTDP-4-dehydrorhamnose 3,5-epimerase [Chitinophagaceae bacterium]|nr:MAG: dTDP-4-dehydrorhamnose 3,5-epimerase [Chitinophagaceae bacterium]